MPAAQLRCHAGPSPPHPGKALRQSPIYNVSPNTPSTALCGGARPWFLCRLLPRWALSTQDAARPWVQCVHPDSSRWGLPSARLSVHRPRGLQPRPLALQESQRGWPFTLHLIGPPFPIFALVFT